MNSEEHRPLLGPEAGEQRRDRDDPEQHGPPERAGMPDDEPTPPRLRQRLHGALDDQRLATPAGLGQHAPPQQQPGGEHEREDHVGEPGDVRVEDRRLLEDADADPREHRDAEVEQTGDQCRRQPPQQEARARCR